MKKLGVVLSVLILWAGFTVEGHAAPDPHVITAVDLGSLPGGSGSFPSAVNDAGVIVGWADTPDGSVHAVKWDRARHIADLGTITGYVQSFATRVNKSGVIAGYVATPEERRVRAVKWSRTGEMTDLGVLPGASDSKPFGLSDNGVAVGISGGPDRFRAVRWSRSGRIEPLGELAGSLESWALDINDHGVAVGYALTASQWHAVRWDADGKITDLSPDGRSGSAEHINDRGEIIGSSDGRAAKWSRRGGLTDLGAGRTAGKITNSGVIIGSTTTSSGLYRPLRWNPGGGAVEELPVLPDQADQWAFAFDVNERGTVVGSSGFRAVTWDRHGGVADLGTLPGGGAARAIHISSAGLIVGDAYNAAVGAYRAVLWQG